MLYYNYLFATLARFSLMTAVSYNDLNIAASRKQEMVVT
jgi:hypothetical protein